jgi:predicted RND superfamily exporter protein
MHERMPTFMKALVGEDPRAPGKHYLRVMLRARERQPSATKRAMIVEVERISREEFGRIRAATPGLFDESDEVRVTGYFVLLTNLIDSMIRDQWITFGYAAAGIGLMMLAAYRSLRLALVALVPNALPIVVVTGVMGWLGLKINMGAAMIAAVSMGLAVDSSIHYITAFRRARSEGLSLEAALDTVQQTVGRAMVFSTLALVVGFSSLCQSQFVPTIYFGALVSLSMLGGLAGNLVVLPLLLRLVTTDRAAP